MKIIQLFIGIINNLTYNKLMITELDKEILKRIIVSDKPLNGNELSYMCHISINTLRKEIDIINDFLDGHGCYIDTKISVGYKLVITDEEIANSFLFDLVKNIYRYSYLNISDYKKENYIIRRILSSNSAISIETLMNELFCSKSTILRCIDRTESYLNRYELHIKAKRNIGLYIDGSEWNKRLCLINQHKILRHSTYNVPFSEAAFEALFLANTDYPKMIRTIFLSHAEQYKNISFSHIDLPMICNFMILLKTRQSTSNELLFSNELLEEIKNTSIYQLSCELCISLSELFKEKFVEKEIDALAVWLYGLRKYNSSSDFNTDEFNKLKSYAEDVFNFVNKHIDIDFIIDEQITLNLSCFLKEQNNLKLCNIHRDDESYNNMANRGIVTADISALVSHYLQEHYHINITLDALSRIYFIFSRSTYEHRQFYEKQRFLIISRYGNYYSNNLSVRIKRLFHKYIDSIDSCEFSDIPFNDLSKYDAIITDIPQQLISVGLPTIEINYNWNSNDFNPIKDYINDIYLKYALDVFKEEDYKIEKITSKNDIYDIIYNSIDKCSISKESWISDCNSRQKLISFEREKGIVLITSHLFNYDKPIFKIIVSDESIIWDKSYSNIFIYYHLGNGSYRNQQTIAYLVKQIFYKSEQELNILPKLKYSEIIKYFNFDTNTN